MNLTKQRILVTGADGFIGSNLTEILLAKGCSVRALSLYNSFNDTLIVAHRLSTVQDCDRLYRLAQGRVVEEGMPETMLLQRQPA